MRPIPGRSAATSATNSSSSPIPARAAVYCDRALARDRHPRRRGRLRRRPRADVSSTGPASMPRPTKCTIRQACPIPADELVTRAASRSARSFISATSIRGRWAPLSTGPDGEAVRARNGLLRHRRVAPGRRADRSEPRRCRHHLAGERRAVPRRPDQSAPGRRRAAARPPTTSTANCSPPGSRCSTTTATNPRAPNSRRWI